jgi:hypothetical protein
MRNPEMAICAATLMLLGTAVGYSQNESHTGQGQAVVTVLPKHEGALPPSVTGQDLSVKVNGKQAKVTAWKPLDSPANSLELVVLIDNAARSNLGNQFNDIAHFVQSLPPNTKSAIAYMQNGQALFAGPLTADPAKTLHELRLPMGTPGSSASPYFCLSDLAKNWPSKERGARREVLMLTDGVDNYNVLYDPDNPYVQAAIQDSVHAGLIVYSIYWQNRGRFNGTGYETSVGQNYLSLVAQATGGKSFWMGMGSPVSLQPYLDELTRRFRNQYELGFTTGLTSKPEVQFLKLKLSAPGAEVNAPERVLVYPADADQKSFPAPK